MLRFYRVEHSTNSERVALALGHKGLEVESIWVPYDERSEVRRVSGQDLVPVLVDGETTILESMEIVRYLDDRFGDRAPLYPPKPARRGDCLLFIDWFDRVWKRPPNTIETELSKPEGERNMTRVERLRKVMVGYLDLFEQILTGREYLLGDFSAADVAAFPFLKYASLPLPEGDDYLFHKVLRQYQRAADGHPQLIDWIARVDRRPRV